MIDRHAPWFVEAVRAPGAGRRAHLIGVSVHQLCHRIVAEVRHPDVAILVDHDRLRIAQDQARLVRGLVAAVVREGGDRVRRNSRSIGRKLGQAVPGEIPDPSMAILVYGHAEGGAKETAAQKAGRR